MKLEDFKEQLTQAGTSWLQFGNNYMATNTEDVDDFLDDCFDFHEAMCTAFVWEETPEGYEFWQDVCEKRSDLDYPISKETEDMLDASMANFEKDIVSEKCFNLDDFQELLDDLDGDTNE